MRRRASSTVSAPARWSGAASPSTSPRRSARVQLHRGDPRALRPRPAHGGGGRRCAACWSQAGEPADAVATMSGGKLQDEVFKVVLEPDLVQPTFVLDYPQAALAAGQGAPDRSRRSPSASSCSSAGASWRTPSASSTIPTTSGGASRTRCGSARPGTRRPMPSTPTTSGRWSTACRRPAAWAWASTG